MAKSITKKQSTAFFNELVQTFLNNSWTQKKEYNKTELTSHGFVFEFNTNKYGKVEATIFDDNNPTFCVVSSIIVAPPICLVVWMVNGAFLNTNTSPTDILFPFESYITVES